MKAFSSFCVLKIAKKTLQKSVDNKTWQWYIVIDKKTCHNIYQRGDYYESRRNLRKK